MVSTRNTSRNNANPPRMQDEPGDVDSRPSDALETVQANTDEVDALRLTNQHMVGELEQLTRQMQRPREARQNQEGHNITPHEGQPHLGTPRDAETKVESSRARGHGPHLTPGEEGNEATPGGHFKNDELNPPQQGIRERSWEQMSHPNSRSDLIGGSEPSSGCEIIYWDFFFFFKKPNLYLWV